MDDVLYQLAQVRGVGGCMVLSEDGLVILSHLRADCDEERCSMAVAEMLTQAREVCERTNLPTPRFLHAQGPKGGILVQAAGPGHLAVVADPRANLALLKLETRPYLEAIAKRLSL